MPLLLLAPRISEDSVALWKAAGRVGWTTERLSSWQAPEELSQADLAVYAEPLFVAAIADTLGLAMIEPSLDWLPSLPRELLRRRIYRSTLKDARSLRSPAFIKAVNDKTFPAAVHEAGLRIAADDVLSDDTPVLISDVVQWEDEYRCFVLDGRVQTASIYWRDGCLARNDDGSWMNDDCVFNDAIEFAEQVLGRPGLASPPAFVLDVGRIRGQGWAVIEGNSAWAAGIYGCDPERVLPAVYRATRRRHSLAESDCPWIVERTWEHG
ncbi:MAG: ATP-grasp domain-containing protein [Tepidisphaerales bacterium]